MNYQDRIDLVIDYIGKNLNDELTLEELCQVACFSKYHFHRLFTANTGVSLKSYIKWLRLKRAAHQLTVQKEDPIIHIALNAGFESHESFGRAFKQICGQSPSQFRSTPNWLAWENPPHASTIRGTSIMDIEIRDLPSRKLAVMEHHGAPAKMSQTLNALIDWARAQPIDLKPKPGRAFGFGYHDPREVAPEDFRFDLALQVPENYPLNDKVIERHLPQGRYAVATHKGSRDKIGDTIWGIYRDWIPACGEELADLPCLLCYHNFDHEVAETELLTEIWVLLK